MKTSDSIAKLTDALIKASLEFETPKKSAEGVKFGGKVHKFADINEIIECTGPALSKNGLRVIQLPFSDGSHVGVTTRLVHTSGEWIEDRYGIEVKNPDPQTFGKVITFFRRYSMNAVLCLGAEDDDAESAMKDYGGSRADKPAGPVDYNLALKLCIPKGAPHDFKTVTKYFRDFGFDYRDDYNGIPKHNFIRLSPEEFDELHKDILERGYSEYCTFMGVKDGKLVAK